MRRVSDEKVAEIIANAGLDEDGFTEQTEGLARDLRDCRALLAKAEEAAKAVEWNGPSPAPDAGRCSCCGSLRPKHRDYCILDAVLREIAASREVESDG